MLIFFIILISLVVVWPIVVVFSVFLSGSMPFYGLVYYFSLAVYPIVSVLTLILIYKKNQYKWFPFFIYLALILGVFLIATYINYQRKNGLRSSDQLKNTQIIDSKISINTPKSFSEFKRYDDYSTSTKTYISIRDTFADIGGQREPVILGVRFYIKKEDMNLPVDEYGAKEYFYSRKINLDDFENLGNKVFSFNKKVSKNDSFGYYDNEGVFVYNNEEKNYRVYMIYWDSFLTKDAAKMMFGDIITNIFEVR